MHAARMRAFGLMHGEELLRILLHDLSNGRVL
jgi:hypothetical protein